MFLYQAPQALNAALYRFDCHISFDNESVWWCWHGNDDTYPILRGTLPLLSHLIFVLDSTNGTIGWRILPDFRNPSAQPRRPYQKRLRLHDGRNRRRRYRSVDSVSCHRFSRFILLSLRRRRYLCFRVSIPNLSYACAGCQKPGRPDS